MKPLVLRCVGIFALALVAGCLTNENNGPATPTAPAITSQPQSISVAQGANATFSVMASGTGLTYQWQENSVNLADGGGISGATTNSLSITNVLLSESGNGYRCVVTNSVGSATSLAGVLTVTAPALAITAQPQNVTVSPAGTATFSVTATGSGLTYQWTADGVNLSNTAGISGATSSSLTITGILAVEGGTVFRCVVTGASGSVTSNSAILYVNVAVTSMTLTAGAQGNDTIPPASFLDLDVFLDFLESEVTFNGNDGEIDLFFGSGTAGMAIYSPNVAKNGIGGAGGGFNIAQSLNPANTTAIRSVPVANFASVSSKAQVDSLWLVGSSPVADGRLVISNGSLFMAKTDLGLVVLIQVSNLTSGPTGTVTLTGKAYF